MTSSTRSFLTRSQASRRETWVDATCTNALNKEAMNKALEYYHGEKSDGYTHFDGHTEKMCIRDSC